VYLSASDPEILSRTWTTVMAEICTHGRESTRERYTRAMEDRAFNNIRKKLIVETTAADLLASLRAGTNCTNHHLRRLHNLALGLGWRFREAANPAGPDSSATCSSDCRDR
jgi:hypothetical protein